MHTDVLDSTGQQSMRAALQCREAASIHLWATSKVTVRSVDMRLQEAGGQ